MRLSKTWRLVVLLCTAALLFAACGDDDDADVTSDDTEEDGTETTAPEEERGTLTVCTDAPYEPFEFQDADGEWTGFDMEIMREVADRMGSDLEVSVQPFEGIWLAPAAGTCDIVASAMTITEDRAENALFSDPYFDADQSLLVVADNADEFDTLDSLSGKVIGVQSGTTGQSYAQENAPANATVREFDEEGAIFLALEAADIDAVLQDLPVNAWRAVQSDGALVVTETFATGETYGFAAEKSNTDLIEEVNAALADIREDGTYDDIYEDWFGEVAE